LAKYLYKTSGVDYFDKEVNKAREMSYTEVEKAVLEKLFNHRYIGERHTSIDNVPKGFPKHEYKRVRKAVKKLIKEGLIIVKPTSYGIQVSLNPAKIDKIREIIEY